MKFLNDARARAVSFGAAGGFLGAMVAEVFVGNPQSFAATLIYGCLSGLGIGAAFGLSEGVGAGAVRLGARAAFIGGILGFVGGGFGSGLGQAVSAVGGRHESVFSGEMARRLQDAGARSGEIEVGLIWRDRNDLDLHVWDPNGEEVYWKNTMSRSGGELDVDRNAMCRSTTVSPVEHVVWGEGALHGTYRIGVDFFDRCELSGGPSQYEVEVMFGGQSRSFQGVLAKGEPLAIVHEFEYTGKIEPEAGGGRRWQVAPGFRLGAIWASRGHRPGRCEKIQRNDP